MGVYTAASVMVMAITGPSSSLAPSSAASTGVRPSRTWRSTFSTITIASSTTSPTDSTTASSVRRLSEKPKLCIRNTPPISESGMAASGISTERTEPRNRKMTIETMSSVSDRVFSTS